MYYVYTMTADRVLHAFKLKGEHARYLQYSTAAARVKVESLKPQKMGSTEARAVAWIIDVRPDLDNTRDDKPANE